MPNWVATVVEFSGDKKDIQAVLKEIASEETKFDFGKLIPVPTSLDIESGSKSSLAYAYYYVKKFNRLPDHSYYKDESEVISRVEKNITVSSQEMLDIGKTLYENIEKYGAPTWYEWCCDNWGTKWNAYEADVCDNTLYFFTAWSFAEPVMRKLAELCAKYNVGFEGEWADEDMGSNTGCFESYDGEFYYNYHDDNSHEAYAAYVRLNGESNCLGVDADGKYYRHECDELCPNHEECMGW